MVLIFRDLHEKSLHLSIQNQKKRKVGNIKPRRGTWKCWEESDNHGTKAEKM